MMRNKKIFGEDVDVFQPERYLDRPNGEEMQRTVELVFGTGRWMCVGKQVALMERNKIFCEVSLTICCRFQRHSTCRPGRELRFWTTG